MAMKTIQVPEEFHAYVKAQQRDGETLGETLVRLAGGPHPEAIEGELSDETAEQMLAALRNRDGKDRRSRERLAEQFEGVDDS